MAGRVLAEKKVHEPHFGCFSTIAGVERPLREGDSSGFQITVIKRTDNRVEDVTGDTNDFDTGLQLKLNPGTYVELVPNNNLHRSGYTMFGPIVLDSTTIGSIVIPLYKFREGDDIEVPVVVARAFLKVERPDIWFYNENHRGVSIVENTPLGVPLGMPTATHLPRGARGGGNAHMW